MVATIINLINVGDGEGEVWRIQEAESGEVLGIFGDKSEALETARLIAQERGAKISIQTRDGAVEWTEEYDWGWELPPSTGTPDVAIRVVSVVEGEGQTWFIEGDEPNEVIGASADKEQAIAMARGEAQARRAQLIVHLPSGSIEWTEDYAWAEAH